MFRYQSEGNFCWLKNCTTGSLKEDATTLNILEACNAKEHRKWTKFDNPQAALNGCRS